MRETFPKKDKLCGKKTIDCLFAKGQAIFIYPFKLIYLKESGQSGITASVLISIPKKHIRLAVERNRLKRLFRESYRKQKHILLECNYKGKLNLAFIYTGKTLASYGSIEKAVLEILIKTKALIEDEINNPSGPGQEESL